MTILPPNLLRRIRKRGDARPPAFILGVECNGLSFLRSLGRRGIPVVMVDFWRNPGMISRYGLPVVVPDAEEDEAGLLGILEELAEAAATRGVVIATGDAYVLFAAKHQRELAERFDLAVSDHETILTVANKRRLYEFAPGHGVTIPRTWFPEDQAIEEIATQVDYPCLIKPYFSHLWRNHPANWAGKMAKVHSAAELVVTYREMRTSGLEFMVQERIGGGDDQLLGLYGYLDRSSEPLGLFTKHKLRQYPRHFGDGSVHVSRREPEVAEQSLKLLRSLGFHGLVNVEFKRDPRDGDLKLMEINARSGAATWHAVMSGVDLPFIAYRDAMNQPTEKALTFREGVRWINLEKDFRSFLDGRRAGESDLGSWVQSLRGDRCYAYFAWDDPLPAISGVGHALYGTVRRRRNRSP